LTATIPVVCRDYLGISDETGYTLARTGRVRGDAAIKSGAQWRVSVRRLLRNLHGEEKPADPDTTEADVFRRAISDIRRVLDRLDDELTQLTRAE
jgi:hypothetical protein